MEDLINHLQDRINDMAPGGRPTDDMAFTGCLALAGRMAALGDDSALHAWPGLFNAVKVANPSASLEEILLRRIRYERWAIFEQLGEDLALSLINVSDFSLFFQRESKILPKGVCDGFRTLFADAELVTLDTEAADFLRGWLEMWPIPEEERLLPMVAPMSEIEETILSRNVGPAPNILVDASDAEEGSVTAATPWGDVQISYRWEQRQRMSLILLDTTGNPFPFQRVFLGPLPALRDDDQPQKWTVDLSVVSESVGNSLLEQGLTAIFPLGGRVTFGSLSGRNRTYDRQMIRRRVIPALLREKRVLAAAAGQESIPDSCSWISPDKKMTAWGIYRKKKAGEELFEIHFSRNTETNEVPVGKEWNGRGVRLFGVGGTMTDGCVMFDLSAVQSQIRSWLEKSSEEPAGLEVAVLGTDDWEVWFPCAEEE